MPNYPQSDIIRRFFTKGQPLELNKGELVLSSASATDGVFYISTGFVKIYSISDAGEEYVHIVYGPGELFPLLATYLNFATDSLFYEALSETLVWRMSRDWFMRFIAGSIEASNAMALQLAQQFQFFSERVDNLEYKKASERVAYSLLFLANRFGVRKGQSIVIEAPITHDLLASSVNLARESVSREFEKLERENIVERAAHHIVITDVNRLTDKLSEPIGFVHWHLLQP
ncbi:MAG: Crp/Fnr family transcriptional regulator [Candidatus Saccharibacteria bacterium]